MRAALAAKHIPTLLITKPENLFYLTGFRGSAGACALNDEATLLWVDPRYSAQAREQACGAEVIETRHAPLRTAGKWLRKSRQKAVGFEDAHVTFSQFEQLRGDSPATRRWTPASAVLEELREVKDDLEIGFVRRACQLTSEAFEEFVRDVKPGISEADLASELDYRMRRRGAEGPAFETIVASGARAALPHAHPSAKLLKPGEFVIIDAGAILSAYRADMTRTLYLGDPDRRARSLYRAVLEAQRSAIEALLPGTASGAVDRAARRMLERRGLVRFFTHSTGHGVGLEIHEPPRIGRAGKARIRAGNIVTAEPGVYIEGLGGVRIEDTVLVAPEGPEILTAAPKENWFVS